MASVVAALAIVAPGIASAAVGQTQITSWVAHNVDPQNPSLVITDGQYLESFDNPPNPTTLTVSGVAPGALNTDLVDIVCYYGAAPSQYEVLQAGVHVSGGAFTTSPDLESIAHHACRLRAIPAGTESGGDSDLFAGPRIAVSESGLPTHVVSGNPNSGSPYDFYVNATTFTGTATWGPAGTCGPFAAPLDQSYGTGNFAIDCMGSLLRDDLGAFGGRSEVQIDGHNAYDAYSAANLFAGSANLLGGFPALNATVNWDPNTGLVSSQSDEGWVECTGLDPYRPASAVACPSYSPTGVQLQRNIGTSEGGQVVTMTDTWTSTNGAAHTVDLLYDDYVGLASSNAERGYELPGQTGFTPYTTGDSVAGPSAGPGSILVRTNLSAPDGDPAEGVGAITFSNPPSAFRFTSNNEFEEHQVLQVPAGGSASLTYIYSVGYTVAAVEAEALAAQDRIEGPALAIASPATGTTVSSPTVTLAGIATSGSGIASLLVAGQPATLVPGGGWTSQVSLNPGANTINAVMVDGAGQVSQAQITVNYQPPAGQPPPPPPAACKVPKTKGKKQAAAEKAIRNAHCKVGKVKKQHSKKVKKGRVISTSPPAGRKLASGWKIELFVSSGPPPPSHWH